MHPRPPCSNVSMSNKNGNKIEKRQCLSYSDVCQDSVITEARCTCSVCSLRAPALHPRAPESSARWTSGANFLNWSIPTSLYRLVKLDAKWSHWSHASTMQFIYLRLAFDFHFKMWKLLRLFSALIQILIGFVNRGTRAMLTLTLTPQTSLQPSI